MGELADVQHGCPADVVPGTPVKQGDQGHDFCDADASAHSGTPRDYSDSPHKTSGRAAVWTKIETPASVGQRGGHVGESNVRSALETTVKIRMHGLETEDIANGTQQRHFSAMVGRHCSRWACIHFIALCMCYSEKGVTQGGVG